MSSASPNTGGFESQPPARKLSRFPVHLSEFVRKVTGRNGEYGNTRATDTFR